MCTGAITLDHQLCGQRQAGISVTIHQRQTGAFFLRQLLQQFPIGTVHGQKSGLQNIDVVDLLLGGKPDAVEDLRAAGQQRIGFLPALFGHLFGVIESGQLQPAGQHHTGRAYRPGQRATPHLINAAQAIEAQGFIVFPQKTVIGHCGILSSVMRPIAALRNSSSSMMAARSVFASPPEMSIPRLRAMRSSSS